jgi:hypothetical protein
VGCPTTAKEARYEVAVDIADFDNIVRYDDMPDYAGMRSRLKRARRSPAVVAHRGDRDQAGR